MHSIEFMKSPEGFRYLDLDDFKSKLTEEIQELLKGRKDLAEKKNISVDEITLPISVAILFDDFTAIKCAFSAKNKREKLLGLQAVKRVVHSPDHKGRVTHVLVIMEAWMGSFQMSEEDKAKYTDEELQRRYTRQFDEGKIEKVSTVIFTLASPATKEVNGKTVAATKSEVTIYKLLEDTFLTHHTTNVEAPEQMELTVSPHLLFFNDLNDEEKEQNKQHGFKIFNALDAIAEVRHTLLSVMGKL